MNFGFLIPVYNHGITALEETRVLLEYGYPVILIDDGSDEETKSCLEKAKSLSSLVHLKTLEKNLGKGGALNAGFALADELGLTNVLQIDADGQHDINRIPRFISLAEENPDALICGYPAYDDSAPPSRAKGRGVANFFTHLYTFDWSIRDSMCGFRVYPVGICHKLTSRGIWDLRMGYDIEILIKLYYHRVRIVNESVKVTYPEGGLSHFRMVRDNARISWTFTRLFFILFLHIGDIIYQHRRKR
ncbi:MAG: glycosyltransferase family 2 protein [Spirochaetales bacterium]|nr:glycosyltransferase family 2 protein [Spirochaetales bacterium]